ncbi:SURF1 family-domain-containing protein [Zychaea mexicana]|uniref:SURF1 family-domain-containing protein n=1 Tax=Zychaea mexicana TaxID=64656 RepID=UPI0022FDC909|nr:SURF1 family-domain-containing protein [Zychaea mexicana]KAI9488273.1 SURF1 family-domain-containing protein [Zychaea mexicana]
MQTEAFENTEPVFQRRRRFGLGTVLMCTVPFIAFGLGTWQVQRLRWKVNLIQEMEERMEKRPIPLPRRINQDALSDYEYRKVSVTGKYRHDQEMLLGPRTRGDGQAGYFLVTPLVRENGTTILVKRGWVPLDKKDKRVRPDSLTDDTVEVEGLLRMSEKRNAFTPDNDLMNNQWYWTDVETMAKLTGAEPLLVERVSYLSPNTEYTLIDKGIPVGRSPVVEVRNSHLNYIVTWYSLSAFTSVMLWRLLKKPVNRPMKVKRL